MYRTGSKDKLGQYKLQSHKLWNGLDVDVNMVKVKQFHYRPGQALRGSRRLRLPDF
jgi:hypothetical protein